MKITMVVENTRVTIETDYEPCSSSDIARTDAAKKELFEKLFGECVRQMGKIFAPLIPIMGEEGGAE